MQKAVIYARVSSTGDRQSTARQVADLKSYAATGGMDIAGIYEEHISGAVRNEDRAVLQECLEHCFSNDGPDQDGAGKGGHRGRHPG